MNSIYYTKRVKNNITKNLIIKKTQEKRNQVLQEKYHVEDLEPQTTNQSRHLLMLKWIHHIPPKNF